jgi:hypothetical protein
MTDTQTPDRKWASIGGREARMVNSDTQTALYRSQIGLNKENSLTFDRCVSPLVGTAAHESNVWVLSDKGRKREK